MKINNRILHLRYLKGVLLPKGWDYTQWTWAGNAAKGMRKPHLGISMFLLETTINY